MKGHWAFQFSWRYWNDRFLNTKIFTVTRMYRSGEDLWSWLNVHKNTRAEVLGNYIDNKVHVNSRIRYYCQYLSVPHAPLSQKTWRTRKIKGWNQQLRRGEPWNDTKDGISTVVNIWDPSTLPTFVIVSDFAEILNMFKNINMQKLLFLELLFVFCHSQLTTKNEHLNLQYHHTDLCVKTCILVCNLDDV